MRRFSTAILAAIVLAPASRANVVGTDNQVFNPVAGSTDFVTVESAATLAPGRFNLGLFVDDAANTLPFKNEESRSPGHINDTVLGTSLGAGVGLLPGLELGVAAPFVDKQAVDGDSTRGEYAETGNTALRVGLKYALAQGRSFGLALVGSATVDRTVDDPSVGATSDNTTYNAELALDRHAGRAVFGLNLGYRMRQPGGRLEDSIVGPIGNQYLASAAVGYKLDAKTSLITEVYGERPVVAPVNDSDRSPTAAEALAGVRYAFTPALLGHAGGGMGLDHGLATPSWRLYAGLVAELGGSDETAKTSLGARRNAKPAAPAAPPNEDQLKDVPNDVAMAQLPQRQPDEVFVLRNINFEFDSDYRVLVGALAELQKLTDHLQAHPGATIVVEGHCDYYGSDEYNDDLSVRRARTVRHAMIKHYHFSPDQIIAVGYGKRRPMTSDPSDYGRQLNRRVEFKVYYDRTAHH